jgi:beta propeller repeat protein
MHRTTVIHRLVPLVLLLTATLALATTLLTTAGTALASPPYAPETAMALGPTFQDAPQFIDGLVVWEEDAAGDWNVVIAGPLGVLPAGTSDQRHPVAGGSLLVYEDDRGGTWDLYAWQTDALQVPAGQSAESAVATGAGDQLDPAADGDLVAYEDTRSGNSDIALHDLGTHTSRFLVRNAAAQVDPSMDGRWVAWADRRNGNWDIYAYDLKTGRAKQVTSNRADQRAPHVGQGKVVYQDRRNGNWDVYECTLSSGKERRLTSGRTDQTAPCIDTRPVEAKRRGNVVFVQGTGDAGDVYLRDGATGIIKPVCTEPGAQTSPVIQEERVLWTDERDGTPDVYAAVLDYPFLTVPSQMLTCAYAGTAKLSGRLLAAGAGGQKVRVAGYGATRTAAVRSTGEDEGAYALSLPRVTRKLTLRVWFPGDASHLPAWGGTVVVKPRAVLTRPALARTPGKPQNGAAVSHPSRCTISGQLRPAHPAGSRAVTVLVYRKNSYTDWRLYRTVPLKVTSAGTASTYRMQFDMTQLYSWRVQAVHEDAGHAKTESAFSFTLRGSI